MSTSAFRTDTTLDALHGLLVTRGRRSAAISEIAEAAGQEVWEVRLSLRALRRAGIVETVFHGCQDSQHRIIYWRK